jgi:hypothetical protein
MPPMMEGPAASARWSFSTGAVRGDRVEHSFDCIEIQAT